MHISQITYRCSSYVTSKPVVVLWLHRPLNQFRSSIRFVLSLCLFTYETFIKISMKNKLSRATTEREIGLGNWFQIHFLLSQHCIGVCLIAFSFYLGGASFLRGMVLEFIAIFLFSIFCFKNVSRWFFSVILIYYFQYPHPTLPTCMIRDIFFFAITIGGGGEFFLLQSSLHSLSFQ